jgi:hypothetical protein
MTPVGPAPGYNGAMRRTVVKIKRTATSWSVTAKVPALLALAACVVLSGCGSSGRGTHASSRANAGQHRKAPNAVSTVSPPTTANGSATITLSAQRTATAANPSSTSTLSAVQTAASATFSRTAAGRACSLLTPARARELLPGASFDSAKGAFCSYLVPGSNPIEGASLGVQTSNKYTSRAFHMFTSSAEAVQKASPATEKVMIDPGLASGAACYDAGPDTTGPGYVVAALVVGRAVSFSLLVSTNNPSLGCPRVLALARTINAALS